MNLQVTEKLEQLGFHLSKNGNSEHSSSYSQIIQVGSMKAVLSIREFGVGFQYRVLLAIVGKPREQEQWFDVANVMSAVLCLFSARVLLAWARGELEGPLVRRSWNKLISWCVTPEDSVARRNATENGHRDMQHATRKEVN